MKPIRFFLLSLVLMTALAFLIFSQTDRILKLGIEKAGTHWMGVPVQMQSLHLSILTGEMQMTGFKLANVPGYSHPHAMELDELVIRTNLMGFIRREIHIQDLVIRGARIFSEGLTADNHRRLVDNLKSNLPAGGKKDLPGQQKTAGEGTQNKACCMFIIDHFRFEDAQLHVEVSGEEVAKVDFPPIILHSIGKKGAAVTGSEALIQIYGAIANESIHTLSIHHEVIESLVKNKLKSLGLQDVRSLTDVEDRLKNPETLGLLLGSVP
jgi:hypothetical protein